jgi:hypothetical protein
MSSKINIWSIITGHIKTLNDASTGKVSILDYVTFYVSPLTIAVLFSIFGIKVTSDANSLLVNFGAIFTALLLSVLVLVYDQGEKLRGVVDPSRQHNIDLKRTLLEQLYFNICYAIVISVALVFLCLVYTFLPDNVCLISISRLSFGVDFKLHLVSPLILIVVINLLLTILMVVKRMHTLLTINI